jgi:1-aminocyclopropane-1-carboxylate deaminase/D-cysteine desulfhydrase-like pyridoxal-dependent ACC family enzyme
MIEQGLPGNIAVNIDSLRSDLFPKKDITVSMLRLDKLHSIVSGNKIFKLFYFLEEAKNSTHKKIITFGGAFSNHLAATSFACKISGIISIGFVCGEMPARLSHTLQYCIQNGMHLEFINRTGYRKINEIKFKEELKKNFGEHTLIPEGGFSEKGVKGAEMIGDFYKEGVYSHVCCPVGTATTFAGLIQASKNNKVIGFTVLKNLNDINQRLQFLNILPTMFHGVINDYHFGGYAKENQDLFNFMNSFYEETKIQLDFVYTAKMMFGVYDLVINNYFPPGSNILCIHTGGLQGNKSLAPGKLKF